ncbi:hypothetical protein SBADM41S_00841 [Streptomyces badius]
MITFLPPVIARQPSSSSVPCPRCCNTESVGQPTRADAELLAVPVTGEQCSPCEQDLAVVRDPARPNRAAARHRPILGRSHALNSVAAHDSVGRSPQDRDANTPYEISDEEYAAKVEALGPVDVLCSHIPPEVPELTYDTVARRFERGSTALLDAIRTTRPRYALFGHVHQPLVRRMRIGTTECVNVGHFASTGTPWALTW